MKIVKLYGQNELNIPSDYPQEIILNHPDNEPLPPNFIILSDEEIESRINQYKEVVDEILRVKAEQEELQRQQEELSKPVEDIVNSISSLTQEQLDLLRNLIGV